MPPEIHLFERLVPVPVSLNNQLNKALSRQRRESQLKASPDGARLEGIVLIVN